MAISWTLNGVFYVSVIVDDNKVDWSLLVSLAFVVAIFGLKIYFIQCHNSL